MSWISAGEKLKRDVWFLLQPLGGFRGAPALGKKTTTKKKNICSVVITLVVHVREGKERENRLLVEGEREREGIALARQTIWERAKEEERESASIVEHVGCYVGCRVECMLMEGPSPVATQPEQLGESRDPSLSCTCIHRWPRDETREGSEQRQREAPWPERNADLYESGTAKSNFLNGLGCRVFFFLVWECGVVGSTETDQARINILQKNTGSCNGEKRMLFLAPRSFVRRTKSLSLTL